MAEIRWVGALCALFAVACGSKPEGILLVISAEPGTSWASLEVASGGGVGPVIFPGADRSSFHIHDRLGDTLVELAGRDLGKDPYRYFISGAPTGELSLEVGVAANRDTGTDEGGFGYAYVTFEPGVVREYSLTLEPAAVTQPQPRCFHAAKISGDEVFLTFGADYDCDGFEPDGTPESDCLPYNGDAFPGNSPDVCELNGPPIDNDCDGTCDEEEADQNGTLASCGTIIDSAENGECVRFCGGDEPGVIGEICDGFDTDCNPKTLPHATRTPCFAFDEADPRFCRFGAVNCEDSGGGGVADNCAAGGQAEIVSTELCEKWAECAGVEPTRATDCAYQQAEINTVYCAYPHVVQEQGACPFSLPVVDPEFGRCDVTVLDARENPAIALKLEAPTPLDCSAARLVANHVPDGEVASFEVLLRAQGAEADEMKLVRLVVDVVDVESVSACPVKPRCSGPIAFF